MLNSIRFKFIRGEEVKYISHLDLMKAFDRALRRSHTPIAYSQGFNPHPQMVFGLPLSVGVTSEAEYADFELSTAVEPGEFMERLNKQLPMGLKIVDAKCKTSKDNIMTAITLASYELLISAELKLEMDGYREKINGFMLQPSIIAKKEGKQGIKDVNIRPMIHRLEVKAPEKVEAFKEIETSESENMFCLSALLSAGNSVNLRPDLLGLSLNGTTDLGIKLVKIHRTGLFIDKGGKVADPLEPLALSGI